MAKMDSLDRVVRAEFGSVEGVTPDDARDRAQAIEDAAADATTRTRAEALYEKAEQLREWALAAEHDGDNEATEQSSKRQARDKKNSSSGTRKKGRRKSRSRSRSGRAITRAVADRPDEILAGSVDSAAGMFWSLVSVTIALVLVYRVVTKPNPSVGLLGAIERGVRQAVYPKAAFPEMWTTAQAAVRQPRTQRAV